MIPPMLMKIAIYQEGKKKVNLWLPLILLYFLMVPLFLFLLPAIIVVGIIFWLWKRGSSPFSFGIWIYELWCASKGTIIEVNSKMNRVYIRVF